MTTVARARYLRVGFGFKWPLALVTLYAALHQCSAAFTQSCDVKLLCASDQLTNDPICGSDGRTYSNLCEMKRVNCFGDPVEMKYRGPCLDKGKCPLERSFQLEMAARRNLSTLFIPDCESDGSFSSVQCHRSTGYCWCVTLAGKPVPGTSMRHVKPSCSLLGKVGRRSSLKPTNENVCTTADRSTFSANMIKLFQEEHERETKHHQNYRGFNVSPSPVKKIVEWKFNRLDANHDKKLNSRETRHLRSVVKTMVQPSVCARQFPKLCDLNHDRKLSRSEWALCMGVDVNMAFRLFLTLNKARQENVMMMDDRRPYGSSRGLNGLHAASLLAASSSSSSSSSSSFALKESKMPPKKEVKEEKVDCRFQRQKAIDDHKKNPSSGVYVPSCSTSDDRLYQKVQCHKMTGFCWCAEPQTGKPIPNTSARNGKPNCERPNEQIKFTIRGCSPKKMRRFLFQLFSTLESNMIASGYNEMSETMSRRDMAIRWKFQELDKNKNKLLERKEWKYYRTVLKQWKGVKKCGRHFLRACDVNGDGNITEREWLNCTAQLYESQRLPALNRGRNPFIHILDPNQ